MADFLLDSDVLIWVLRGRTDTVELAGRLQVDAAIAATCLELRLTLVTYNLRDYPYRDISIYPIAN